MWGVRRDVCSGLNEQYPPQTRVFAYLVPLLEQECHWERFWEFMPHPTSNSCSLLLVCRWRNDLHFPALVACYYASPCRSLIFLLLLSIMSNLRMVSKNKLFYNALWSSYFSTTTKKDLVYNPSDWISS